jgi:glycerophosphoryl diester phosphodiesterase
MQLNESSTPIIIAHRGYSRRYPENTLRAFAAAFEAGARMIELDAALTRDGYLVVMHDATIDRTTNGQGPVNRHTLQALKKLDAGAWFHSRFAGERIPELSEVFDRFSRSGWLNVEIKSHPTRRPAGDFLWRRVVDLIEQKGLTDRVLVSSFDTGLLERIAQIPGPPHLAVLSSRYDGPEVLAMCRRIGALAWHPNHRRLKEAHVEMMHAAGIRVFPYTVNSRKEVRRLRRLEVDGLFTDDPAFVQACLSE